MALHIPKGLLYIPEIHVKTPVKSYFNLYIEVINEFISSYACNIPNVLFLN